METNNENTLKNSCHKNKLNNPILNRTLSLTFTGGNLLSSKIKNSIPVAYNEKSCDDISNGFKNTLAVLEKYLKQRKVTNSEIYPANTEESVLEPTALELQLMAIERLKQIEQTSRLAFLLLNYIIFSENIGASGDHKKQNIEKLAANLQKDTSDCLYHIAKEKNGILYLKVVKSPNKERGK